MIFAALSVTSTVIDPTSGGATPFIVGALGTAIGGVGAYLAARRKGSGRIETTDAETLWDASEGIRKEQGTEIASLRSDNASLRTDNSSLRDENRKLRRRIEQLETSK